MDGPNFEKFSFSQKRNPRKDELLARQREGQKLSREDAAELQGIFAFPDNPRGADLLMRDVLGKTTEKEKTELKKHFQREQFSPEVNALWDRVEAGDPNVVQVTMSQGKAIEVSVAGQEKIIWTYGLGGCYGCLVFTEHLDGTRNAVLTHYPPTEISQDLAKLRELIGKSHKMKEASTKQTVLVMAAGEWVQDPITKKSSFGVRDQQTADLLALAVQTELGAGVDIKLEPYSENQTDDMKDQGTLLVHIPASGKGEARYRSWFSGGTLGKQEPKK
ncbi:MAG: hypothetical protein UW24_C0022G0003 [Parcubacteria group bacterium GW2011_GWA2_44_12]|nr:MAG: hypothetical protein UW24_C0022G0003 [Parcubacteria group bacterium GW2011_GWA2_44_12]